MTVHGTLSWGNGGTIGDRHDDDRLRRDPHDARGPRPAHPRHRHTAHRGQRDDRRATPTPTSTRPAAQRRRHRGRRGLGARTLDLQDDQQISDGDGGGRLGPARARRRHPDQDDRRRTGIADVQIPVENDGTVTAAAGRTTWLSGGSSGRLGPVGPGGRRLRQLRRRHPLGRRLDDRRRRHRLRQLHGRDRSDADRQRQLPLGQRDDDRRRRHDADRSERHAHGPRGLLVQRILDTGTLRIEGSATFTGNTDGSYYRDLLANGADIEVGGPPGAQPRPAGRPADLSTATAAADSALHVLAGGTLTGRRPAAVASPTSGPC